MTNLGNLDDVNEILSEDFIQDENVILYTAPILSSSFNATAFLTTDNIVIPYMAANTGMSGLMAAYSKDGGTPTEASIANGMNTWPVGPLAAGNHSLTVQATDNGGGVSNRLIFNFTVFAASAYTGFVINGLTLYLEHPPNHMAIPNPNNYFMDSQFTFAVTAQAPRNANIVSRYTVGSSQNQYQIYRNANNQFTANFYASPAIKSVTSPAYTDETSYYHIVLIRNSSYLSLYVNNVKTAQVTMPSSLILNNTTLPMILGNSLTVNFKNIAYYNRALLPSERLQNYTTLGV